MDGALAKNMRLLSNDRLNGFGGVGEGMAVQIARDGRRIMWLAHEDRPRTSPQSTSRTRGRRESSARAICRIRGCGRTRST